MNAYQSYQQFVTENAAAEQQYQQSIEEVSFLGFPSVFVFAQGVSEAFDMDMLFLKQLKLQRDVQTIMRHLDTATDTEVSKVLQYCMIKRNALLENTFNGIGWFSFHAPMFSAPDDCDFLATVCCYRLGDPEKALAYLESMRGSFDVMPEECASCVHNKECDYENRVAFEDKLTKIQAGKNIGTERLAELFAETGEGNK